MDSVEVNAGRRKKYVRIENSNDIFFRFSLINYSVALIGILIRFLLVEKRVWDMVLLSGVVFAILGQIIVFKILRKSCCYGRFTMVLAAVLFTIANLIFEGSIVLIVLMPMILLCILYMSKKFLNIMYGVWGINAVICLAQILQRESISRQDLRDYVIVVIMFILFGISAYMVNGSVAFLYADVCSSLKSENRRNRQYYKEAIIDSTTGLLNRNAYNAYLKEYAGNKLSSMCCIYIDVNGLHEYNNTYGHQAGDKMLKLVASVMKECFQSDKQYRIGGDEFVILSENSNFSIQLEELRRFRTKMKSHRVHIASGMEWRDEDMDIDEMIKVADTKMYQDKERFYKEHSGNRDNSVLYKKAVE